VSIAQTQRLRNLEERVIQQREELEALKARIAAIENRPKPGRPPKNGV
jgi:BMFP domain-containing protein YqiC